MSVYDLYKPLRNQLRERALVPSLRVVWGNGSTPTTFAIGGTVVAALDWNGDGRTDLLVANGATLGVYLSTGAGISSLIPTSVPYSSSCSYITTDVNGDGLEELSCLTTSSAPFTYFLHNGPYPDLATSFKDGGKGEIIGFRHDCGAQGGAIVRFELT